MSAAAGTWPFGRWDGHCHTGFSGHGRGEGPLPFVKRALDLGFGRITFTEHPLFPRERISEALYREVYLETEGVDRYLDAVWAARERCAGAIEVGVGFEVDFVPGLGDFPLSYLEPRAERVDDGVLSLHFLPGRGGLCAVDMDPGLVARDLVAYHGGVDAVRRLYWQTLEAALETAAGWGLPAPRRLGHLDVIGKFAKRFPVEDPAADRAAAGRVLDRVRELGWSLDVNAKGYDVALRGDAYPAPPLLRDAVARGIALVYGSDAHESAEVGRHRDRLVREVAALQDAGAQAP